MPKRLATNLSAKHWEILENLKKKHLTQRKALEHLLENADKGAVQISKEDEIRLRMSRNKAMVIVPKVCWRLLIEGKLVEATQAAVDGAEMTVEESLRKPFKECTLKEVVEALMEKMFAYNLIASWNLTEYPKRGREDDKSLSLSTEDTYDYALTIFHNEGEPYGNSIAFFVERTLQKTGAITHVLPNQQFGVFIRIKESGQDIYSPILKVQRVTPKGSSIDKKETVRAETEGAGEEEELVQEHTA